MKLEQAEPLKGTNYRYRNLSPNGYGCLLTAIRSTTSDVFWRPHNKSTIAYPPIQLRTNTGFGLVAKKTSRAFTPSRPALRIAASSSTPSRS